MYYNYALCFKGQMGKIYLYCTPGCNYERFEGVSYSFP